MNHHNISRGIIKSLKDEADSKRTLSQKLADKLTSASGSMIFLVLNVVWFFAWILINLGLSPRIEIFDPFPFGLLTMIVSLEAIILAIIVLISQNRAAQVDDLREEIDLHIDVVTEKEVTKILEMLKLLLEKNGINSKSDHELSDMIKPINVAKIKKSLMR